MGTQDDRLHDLRNGIRENCTACGVCVKACAFLTRYGNPRSIAKGLDAERLEGFAMAYECSLCGLCAAVCPEKLDPSRMFLAMRQKVAAGHFTPGDYKRSLGYENRGLSGLLSWFGLPRNCDAVFFPGCTLPGTRPGVTLAMFRDLQKTHPGLGIVFSCCTKPSRDLGRLVHVEKTFGNICAFLAAQGVKTVLAACPNCFRMFQDYGGGIQAKMVYESIDAAGKEPQGAGPGPMRVTVHDPCALRNAPAVHQAVRRMLARKGYQVQEMRHKGRLAICCGEGGLATYAAPDLARAWTRMRQAEAGRLPVVTYCAGCNGFLAPFVDAIHIADLYYRPRSVQKGRPYVFRAPLTYANRLWLKQGIKLTLRPEISQNHIN